MRILIILALGCVAAVAARAVTLEQIISREDPKFDCAKAVLTVGRDGNVYLSSVVQNAGYILRVSRDGSQKLGGDAVYAMANATANADGVIASANAHFNHAVNLYDPTFQKFAVCNEFLVNDKVGWNAPARVEAGASGDFYGIDQHRQRILRVNPAGKIVQVYAIPDKPAAVDFRVVEALETFWLRGRDGTVQCVGFDGTVQWTQQLPGPFTVDDAGVFYVLAGQSLKKFSPTGEAHGEISLPVTAVTGIAVWGDELIVKRAAPAELFQVHALATGERKRTVASDHERFTAEFPSLVWTAGETVPVTVPPRARLWIAPFGDTDWRELVREGEAPAEPQSLSPRSRERQRVDDLSARPEPRPPARTFVQVPADFAGLYQLRIAPTLNPQAESEYLLREVIEVRAPGSRGTVSVWTPYNRAWYGRGEAIPVSIAVRTTNALPEKVTVVLQASRRGVSPRSSADLKRRDATSTRTGTPLWSTNLTFTANTPATFTLPAAFTAQLAPGRYALRADAPGFTSVAQPLRIGPGRTARSSFRVTQHGDYNNFNSTASAWDFADEAEELLARSETLGVNQYVNRIFAGRYPLRFLDRGPLPALTQQLAADPTGVATQKVVFGFPHAHALGALGAHGLREWLLLVSMDAALPIGASMPWAKGMTPEQYAAEIRQYTEPLLELPAFAGWDWVANWWVAKDQRFASPEQKTAYQAALKQADETGAWDPILDEVGDRIVNWQPEAQEIFQNALAAVTTNLATANAGPYRRPKIYPPVTFANVDEVDLHFQAEQVSCPNWTAHATDFYRRPGKPAWLHPELANDPGTGEQILPLTWLGLMRGAAGIGAAGKIPHWGALPTDARSGYPGTPSVFRALHAFARQYGPWLTTTENADRIGIVVSRRQIKVDDWGGIGGRYFTRLWEAFMTCLYARHPATFIYPEDQPDLSAFDALLVVGQRFEPDTALAELLTNAQRQGVAILADGTCRESLVKDYQPLGVAFDQIEKLHGFNNDVAYWEFRDVLLTNAPSVARALEPVTPPVAACDQPEVLVSERRAGAARLVWVVNNTFTALDPGLLWRVQNGIGTTRPVVAEVELPVRPGEVVYDLFSGSVVREFGGSGGATVGSRESRVELTADLRYSGARLYAVLPARIARVTATASARVGAGESLAWSAVIESDRSAFLFWHQPVAASLPIRVQLLDAAGTILEERFTSTEANGRVSGEFVIPLNVATDQVTLEVTELVSGKRGSAPVRSQRRSEPRRAESRDPQSTTPTPTALRPETTRAGVPDYEQQSAAFVVSNATETAFGPRLRDLAISADGATALLNAFDWGQNLYALDLVTGKVRWSGNVGDHFAYAPVALGAGFGVQGYDLRSAEGYHLYTLDAAGRVTRRFALPGLPARLTNWAFTPHLVDRINNFAVAHDGSWIAAAGNLALAVWAPGGRLLWSRDWSAEKRQTLALLALDDDSLVTGQGMQLAAVDARTGQERWNLALAATGEIQGLAASADGQTIAARATTQSGRVYVVRAGRVTGTLPTAADDVVVTPAGAQVGVTTGRELKWYAADGDLQWVFRGDTTLRFPRLSPDGKRLAVSSELGTVYVLDVRVDAASLRLLAVRGFAAHDSGVSRTRLPDPAPGPTEGLPDRSGRPGGQAVVRGRETCAQRIRTLDLGALAVPAWLPDGDLLLATWLGTVCRLDGESYEEKWRVNLAGGMEGERPREPFSRASEPSAAASRELRPPAEAEAEIQIPTDRLTSWSNAAATPLPLTPNLVVTNAVVVRAMLGDRAVKLQHPVEMLFDGQADAPAEPWVKWEDIGLIDSGWRGSFSLEIDTLRTQLRVTAITFVEDPAHPESWLRDAKLEYWDAATDQWVFAQYLTADAPVHTHRLAKPVEAAKFRLARPDAAGWPASNLRFAEIVFHGEVLGSSHPDVLGKKPVAVLFDEDNTVFRTAMIHGHNPGLEIATDSAAVWCGAFGLRLGADRAYAPGYNAPAGGHVIPNWDFEIVENPQPGQYRWLEWAWKTTAPATTGLGLRLNDGPWLAAGELDTKDGVHALRPEVPREWQVEQVDLFKLTGQPFRLRGLRVLSQGGSAAVDTIRLGRTAADLTP